MFTGCSLSLAAHCHCLLIVTDCSLSLAAQCHWLLIVIDSSLSLHGWLLLLTAHCHWLPIFTDCGLSLIAECHCQLSVTVSGMTAFYLTSAHPNSTNAIHRCPAGSSFLTRQLLQYKKSRTMIEEMKFNNKLTLVIRIFSGLTSLWRQLCWWQKLTACKQISV